MARMVRRSARQVLRWTDQLLPWRVSLAGERGAREVSTMRSSARISKPPVLATSRLSPVATSTRMVGTSS